MFHKLSQCGLDQNLTPGYKAEAKRDCASFLETASLVPLNQGGTAHLLLSWTQWPAVRQLNYFRLRLHPARARLSRLVESKWDVCIMCFFSLSLQLFEGNIHYDIPEVRRFDPVPAQYVRVHPERWSPAGIGMRLEVLGCDWTGRTPAPLPTSSIGAASGATAAKHESKVISLPAVPPSGHAVARWLQPWPQDLQSGLSPFFFPPS